MSTVRVGLRPQRGSLVAKIYVTIPWLMRRFGFLAMLSAWSVRFLLTPFVFGSWYASRTLVVVMSPAEVAAWAMWIIVSSAPVSSTHAWRYHGEDRDGSTAA